MRLRRSVLTGPGVRRVRRGRGFAFVDASGRAVDAETRARARALAIPPAWRDVWVCPYPNGHIQAVGTDDAGRRQYLYHPAQSPPGRAAPAVPGRRGARRLRPPRRWRS